MQQIALITKRADAFCARLYDGLLAVAIALALLTSVTLVARAPPPTERENGLWTVDPSGLDGSDGSS